MEKGGVHSQFSEKETILFNLSASYIILWLQLLW